ncbi:MAG TPA: ABC transporter substrate-binding protein [Clostridiales bacterium]|nr:ABC transporter substrate-binding protein [Clostridiales bacterium]
MTNARKKLRLLSLILVTVMLLGLFAACGKSSEGQDKTPEPTQSPDTPETPETPDVPERQTIKIGIATCFTGSGARGAETQLYGLQLALDQINSSGYSKYYDFELIQGDDQYDATEAVAVANKLVYQDGVKAVFGHLNAVVTLAGLGVYEEAKVPCFTPSGSSEKIVNSGYEYVYLCVPQDRIIAASLMNYLVNDLGLTKLGILYCNNDQGQSGLEFCKTALADLDMEFVDEQAYLATDNDFTGQMLSMKGSDVEVLVIWGGEVSQRSIMVQQARQLIGTDVIISGDANFSNATFISVTTPEEREGIIYPVAWSPAFTDERSATYVEEFKAKDPLEQTPGAVTVRFYDGMWLLATALNNMGPYDVDAEDFTIKLNEAIKQSSYEGLQGTLTPAPNGECLDKCYIVHYTLEGEELIK